MKCGIERICWKLRGIGFGDRCNLKERGLPDGKSPENIFENLKKKYLNHLVLVVYR